MLSPSSNYIDNCIIRKLWNLTAHPLFPGHSGFAKVCGSQHKVLSNSLLLLRILTIRFYCILLIAVLFSLKRRLKGNLIALFGFLR